MLFKIEAAERLGYTNISCTSQACNWNNYFRAKIECAPIKDINFYSEISVERVTCNARKRRVTSVLESPLEEEQQQFIKALTVSSGMPVALSLFKESFNLFKCMGQIQPPVALHRSPRALYDVACQKLPHGSEALKIKSENVINQLSATQSQLEYLEEITRNQSSNIVWHEQRAGLFVSHSNQWLAASPDGVITCSCHGTSTLEIKYPYNFRDTTIDEFLKDPSAYIQDGMLDPSHKFYTQVQLQIYVCGAKNSDFVVFVNGSLLCLSVSIDQPFLDDVIPRLKTFWLQHIAPEILTRRLENRKSSTTLVPASNDKKLYCNCQEAWDQKALLWAVMEQTANLNGFI